MAIIDRYPPQARRMLSTSQASIMRLVAPESVEELNRATDAIQGKDVRVFKDIFPFTLVYGHQIGNMLLKTTLSDPPTKIQVTEDLAQMDIPSMFRPVRAEILEVKPYPSNELRRSVGIYIAYPGLNQECAELDARARELLKPERRRSVTSEEPHITIAKGAVESLEQLDKVASLLGSHITLSPIDPHLP